MDSEEQFHEELKQMDAANTISEWARKGAALGVDHGKMCNECAFKKGGLGNNEEHTVAKAIYCMAAEGKFNCHNQGEGTDAGKPCAGWLYAKSYVDKPDQSPEIIKSK